MSPDEAAAALCLLEAPMHKLNRLRRPPRRRHTLRCGFCGKFLPRSAQYSGYNWDVGAAFVAWDCPHCGETDSTI